MSELSCDSHGTFAYTPPSPNKRDLTRQEVGTQLLGLLRDEPNISNAEV
jgi:hypothetical protein